ncbi:peptidase M24, structural domain-containing protein [Spinellus fusiger]|nr:peptidase M24, structural domain-containing protein [Spinellus fusiger]
MTDMEVTPLYTPTKFALDNDLVDPKVLEKYLLSANIVNTILPVVLSKVSAGVSVHDLCQYGDDLLEAHTVTIYKNAERGIALPTCVTINNHVQYFSPLLENDYTLKPNDLVKVELGVHVDGYIATAAHSTIVNTTSEPITGRAADVVCATYFAYEAAMRMLKPGVKGSEISRVISEIGAYYRCKPVQGTFSSLMKRFVLRAGKDIENKLNEEVTLKELEALDFEIENNQVYQLNIVMTTSEDGRVKTAEEKPFIYQRNVNTSYQLKMRSARIAFSEINNQHSVFPFSTRALSGNQARLGLVSLSTHDLITPYTVMRTLLPSDLVAQFKSTVLVLPEGPMQLTASQPLPYVHSQYCIPQSTTAALVLSTARPKQAKSQKPLPPVQVTMGERRAQVEDVEME